MRRFSLTFALVLFAATLGLHGTAHAAPPPARPAPDHFVNGRPVWDFDAIKDLPGVTIERIGTTAPGKPRLAYAAVSSGYGSGPITYYGSYVGTAYDYAYLNVAYYNGVPWCVQAQGTFYLYPNVPAYGQASLYLNGYGYYATQGGTIYSGSSQYTGCYGTYHGESWYSITQIPYCYSPYSCSASAYAYWYEY